VLVIVVVGGVADHATEDRRQQAEIISAFLWTRFAPTKKRAVPASRDNAREILSPPGEPTGERKGLGQNRHLPGYCTVVLKMIVTDSPEFNSRQ